MTARILGRLERGRLVYERIGYEHADELAALMAEPGVRETLWPWPEPPTPKQLADQQQHWIDHWELNGFGLWVLRDAGSGEFVGRGGLEYNDVEGRRRIEAAWAIMPARWGQGLATELARTTLEQAFGPLGLDEVIALTLPHNLASRRVMEKTGFSYERDVVQVGLPHVLYRRGRC
jgi:RimJ/RimL family protein N-acetyltransferase